MSHDVRRRIVTDELGTASLLIRPCLCRVRKNENGPQPVNASTICCDNVLIEYGCQLSRREAGYVYVHFVICLCPFYHSFQVISVHRDVVVTGHDIVQNCA